MELTGKRVLVTGAGGFIGSHLVERLVNEGCAVRAFVHYNSAGSEGNLELLPREIRSEIDVFSGDVIDPYCVRKAITQCDVVFHLAALIAIPYSYIAPHSYVMTNVLGTLNVMQACRDFSTQKIVHTSTSETFGSAIYVPIDENHPLQGQSPYAASKIGADKIAESYFCSFDLPVATIRPFNTYGPRQSARAVIPTIITQILAGQKTINLGLLKPVRDFTYVKDTVEGFICVAKSDESIGELVNVGSGVGISIGDLANTIIRLDGGNVEIKSDSVRLRPKKSEVMKLICANDKATALVGWQPRYTLEQGLRETMAFIEQYPQLYKSSTYNI